MNRDDLFFACDRIAAAPVLTDARAITYHASYPAILRAFQVVAPLNAERLMGCCVMIYGWMPRVVWVKLDQVSPSLGVIDSIRRSGRVSEAELNTLGSLLSSLVGASKLLHFLFPDAFPIWDSRIEARRIGRRPSEHHLRQAKHLIAYYAEMSALCTAPWLGDLRQQFQPAFTARLRALSITPYTVSDMRMLEYLIFETEDEQL